MKILIISRGVPTAKAPLNGIFEWDQALALKNANVEVAYLALDFRKITEKRFWGIRRYVRDGISVFELSLPTGIYRRGLPLLQWLCRYMYQKVEKQWGKPDVLHTHFYFMGAIAAKLPNWIGVPLVHTEHSSKLNKPLSSISSIDKKLTHKAFAAASCITTVSTAYADRLHLNFGINAQVVPNVLAIQNCLSNSTPKQLNADLLHNQITASPSHRIAPFTWISVGRLIASKGMMDLLDAFHQVVQQCPDQQLLIVGDGPQYAALKRHIEKLQLTNKVSLLGAMSRAQVQQYLQKSHAFVLLSESETFGVSYVEAMAMGLPVVATDCGGPSDFVNDANGLLVPVNDVKVASQAMQNITNQYAIYRPAAIAKQVVTNYAPATIAQKLVEIYASVCGRNFPETPAPAAKK